MKSLIAAALMIAFNEAGFSEPPEAGAPVAVNPATMPQIGSISERYQSYNLEMIEVTGGKFWKPYDSEADPLHPGSTPAAVTNSGGATPVAVDADLYAYRAPVDLSNARLRKLAAALGPAYVRVSGTWANTTYFPDADAVPAQPPAGFGSILTRQQWKGVVDFSHAADANIVTSFAMGVGTRNAEGDWTPDQASLFLAYTKSVGGSVAAAEFMNEPTLAALEGAPAAYDAKAYGRDFNAFITFARQAAPKMLILGPGSVGETSDSWAIEYGLIPMLKTRDLLQAANSPVDLFSYHHYGASSIRCAGLSFGGTTAEAALSEDWLNRTDKTLAFYRALREEFQPGKPIWLTETADAACGGNPWGGTFLDTFRYLDQLGRLAKQGVQVVIHNTLEASDYGLLEEHSFTPKPNYWGALLWRRLMGTNVLECGVPIRAGLHVYAHSRRGVPGGVAMLVINTDKASSRNLTIPLASVRYTLTATSSNLWDKRVQLNGQELKLGFNDELPPLVGLPVPAGEVAFAPGTITFLALPKAGR
jgi:hypothetical protein